MTVHIDIVSTGDLHCQATHGPSGKTLLTDAPVDNGGKGEEFSPTDLVATALGSCILTIMDVVGRRSGIDIKGTTVHVTKDMTTQPPRRISRLTARIVYPASLVLSAADRTKIEKAAMQCPVKQSLHPDVEIVVEFPAAG